MRFISKIVIFLASTLILAFMTGCSFTPTASFSAHTKQPVYKLANAVDFYDNKQVARQLLSHYQTWRGTPYRYGGESRQGIDCSAFVQQTFTHSLGYKLTRTTKTQIKQGHNVAKTRLKSGDIVFFKTGSNQLHNGVYVGNKQFMHASSSQGVTLSRLDNPYWQKTFYTAKRIR